MANVESPSHLIADRDVTMSWDAQYILRQLLATMPGPRHLWRRRKVAPSMTPAVSYGCCPACNEFVAITFGHRAGTTPCPKCGRWISSLLPLGSSGTTEVGDGA
jgi:cytochrome P450